MADISKIKLGSTTYNVKDETARTNISNVASQVSNIEPYVLRQINRRYVIISDSYGLGRNGTTPWTDYLRNLLNVPASDYYAYSVGSLGFNQVGDGGYTPATLLQAHSGDITDHANITDVIFGLGDNDIANTTGLLDAIGVCMTYVKSEYPNATIHIGFIGNLATKNGTVLNNYRTALEIYYTACAKYGAKPISGVEYVMHNATLMQVDGIHPTSEGSSELANFVRSYLLGESPEYHAHKTCPITTSYFAASNAVMSIDGSMASMNIILGVCNNNINWTAREYIDIGTIDDPLFTAVGGFPVYFRLSTFSGTTSPFNPLTLLGYLYNGHLYVSSGSNSPVTVASGIVNYPTTVNAPTLNV